MDTPFELLLKLSENTTDSIVLSLKAEVAESESLSQFGQLLTTVFIPAVNAQVLNHHFNTPQSLQLSETVKHDNKVSYYLQAENIPLSLYSILVALCAQADSFDDDGGLVSVSLISDSTDAQNVGIADLVDDYTNQLIPENLPFDFSDDIYEFRPDKQGFLVSIIFKHIATDEQIHQLNEQLNYWYALYNTYAFQFDFEEHFPYEAHQVELSQIGPHSWALSVPELWEEVDDYSSALVPLAYTLKHFHQMTATLESVEFEG